MEVEVQKNADFEQEKISLEETVDRDGEFTYVLNRQKFRFLLKCTLYINGFYNSEQFDSICLDYVYQLYQLVKSVEYLTVNMKIICRITLQVQFVKLAADRYKNKFYHNSQAQICTKAFQYSRDF